MNVAFLAGVLRARAELRSHDRWSRQTLVTVLFSRTQPLIRYEMSDRVQALDGSCPDGLSFALIGGVEGREEDLLTLAGVTVHPNVFHRALERVDVAGWQVVDEGGRLRILLARPAPVVDPAAVERSVASALDAVGVRGIAIVVECVEAIPRTALGKAPLVRRARREVVGATVR